MVNGLSVFFFFLILFVFSRADYSPNPQPQELESFKINNTQVSSGCSYTVSIKTSCSSISYTRDAISLDFGDAYGNEVYAARLDDPSSRIFERCSTDTFKINGPCSDRICYLYLRRIGSDGWKPEWVKVYPGRWRATTFNYDVFLPNGVWYGFNLCGRASTVGDGNGDTSLRSEV